MKFNFFGYDTKTMLDLGLDGNDLFFIQWFRDFRDSGKMESITTDKGLAYYVGYNKVIEDIPMLFKSSVGVTDELELKKIEATNKKKVFNMLKGNLSKVFTRLEKKEQGKTKIYLALNTDVFTALINNGKDFDVRDVEGSTKVVKLNAPKKKKAPKTEPPVKDADTNVKPPKHLTKNSIEDSISQNDDTVKSEIDDNVNVKENTVNDNTDNKVTGADTTASTDEVDVNDLNMNAYYLYENNIKVGNWTVVNKLVADWSGLILGEAIDVTLASATNPNFNYVKKTYETMVTNGGGVEALEKKLLAPLLGY